MVHNTAQNSSDNLPSFPPDNHHCSDVVYWRGGTTNKLDEMDFVLRRKQNQLNIFNDLTKYVVKIRGAICSL